MLQNTFYTLKSLHEVDGKWLATIKLNPDHPIFEGHFPGTPVVPGVTMMQMTREVAEVILKQKLNIREVQNIKFMSVVDPLVHKEVDMELDIKQVEGGWKISNTMRVGEVICLKFRGLMGE
ncbi:3-hydroxyacyl-ACP dehydratase [bacterium]|nr:3-hydroxyacyl-ACP dehydratase [bacterium]